MLLEMQDGDSGDTKECMDDNKILKSNNNYKNYDIQSQITPTKNKHRVTRKVVSSQPLLQHILSYIPIDSLCNCAFVSKNWYLIIKYIVPIPLINLKLIPTQK